MKRLLICFSLLFSLDIADLSADNEETKTEKSARPSAAGFGVKFELRYNMLRANPDNITFANIPATLRTVPTHKDDGWFGRPGSPRTIPDASFTPQDPGFYGTLAFGVAPQYTIGRFTVRGGAMINSPTMRRTFPIAGDFDSYRAVNQYGKAVRGSGTSLVYYSLYWQSDRRIKIDPYVEGELRLLRHVALLGGYNPSRHKLALIHESGYDRWNALELYRKTKIASLTTETSYYAGIRFGTPHAGFSVSTGPVSRYAASHSGYPGMALAISSDKRMGVFFSVDFRATRTK